MKKPENNKQDDQITDRDVFGSIPRPIDIDPFEGIDLETICVPPEPPPTPATAGYSPTADDEEAFPATAGADELSEINPINGIDIQDLAVSAGTQTSAAGRKQPPSSPKAHPKAAGMTGQQEPAAPKRPVPPVRPRPPITSSAIDFDLKRSSRFAEINRIREKILKDITDRNCRNLLITSPHDGSGNTFLATIIGYNTALQENMSVLLVDLNMRSPGLHHPFKLEQVKGVTEIVTGTIHWRDAVKNTCIDNLQIISAGPSSQELYQYLNRSFIQQLIQETTADYDLVIFDSSPVLRKNRNNIDAVLLSSLCDYTILIIQESKTTRSDIQKTFEEISAGGGKIDGLVYNQQYKKDLVVKSMQHLAKFFPFLKKARNAG